MISVSSVVGYTGYTSTATPYSDVTMSYVYAVLFLSLALHSGEAGFRRDQRRSQPKIHGDLIQQDVMLPPDKTKRDDAIAAQQIPDKGSTQQPASQEVFLNTFCSINMTNETIPDEELSLEYLERALFDYEAIHSLMAGCLSSTWCLPDDPSLWETGTRKFLRLCAYASCLDLIPERLINPEHRIFTISMALMCGTHQLNGSISCLSAMRKLAHVSLADLYREKSEPRSTCNTEIFQDTCSGPCLRLGHDLQCASAQCGHDTSLLSHVPWWHWYYGGPDNNRHPCSNATDCTCYRKPSGSGSWISNFWKASSSLVSVEDMDFKVVSGIVTLGAVSASASVLIIWVCVKRARKRRQYIRDLGEYSELGTTEDTQLFSLEGKDDYVQLT